MGLQNPLGQQPYTANDRKLQFVADYVNAIGALVQAFDRIDDLNTKAALLGYADETTGITDALLTDNAFDYLDRALILEAFTRYTALRTTYTATITTPSGPTTIQTALVRVLR